MDEDEIELLLFAGQLLDDFRKEVRRTLDEKGIANDL
jgi:hypothetical protein